MLLNLGKQIYKFYKFLQKTIEGFKGIARYLSTEGLKGFKGIIRYLSLSRDDLKYFVAGFVSVPSALHVVRALSSLSGLVEGFSYSQHEISLFHDTAIILILRILVFVSIIGISLVKNRLRDRKLLEDQGLETVWTVIPAVLLVFLALPSLRLLYLVDDIRSPSVTAKSVGHQ